MYVNLSHAWFLNYGLYANRPYIVLEISCRVELVGMMYQLTLTIKVYIEVRTYLLPPLSSKLFLLAY